MKKQLAEPTCNIRMISEFGRCISRIFKFSVVVMILSQGDRWSKIAGCCSVIFLIRPQITSDLSVLMPVFAKAHYINSSVSSIQQVPSSGFMMTILCVDDGSRDDSVRRIRDLQENDPQIWLFQQFYCSSTHGARIACVNLTLTPWFIFLDPDDLLVGNGTITALKRGMATGADIVQYGCLLAHMSVRKPIETMNLSSLPRCWGDGLCTTATKAQLMSFLRKGWIDWQLHRKMFRTELYKFTIYVMPEFLKGRRNSRGQDVLHYLSVVSHMTGRYYYVNDVGELWYDALSDGSSGRSYQPSLARRGDCLFVKKTSAELFGWIHRLQDC
jgi:glycosyltransferase involved in cell wall biosynthesis